MKDIELERSVEHLERYWSKMQNYSFYIELGIRLFLTVSGLLAVFQIGSGASGWGWMSLAIISIVITHVILPVFKLDGIHHKISCIKKRWRDLEIELKNASSKKDLDYCRLKFKDMFSEDYGIPVFDKISDSAITDMENYYEKG